MQRNFRVQIDKLVTAKEWVTKQIPFSSFFCFFFRHISTLLSINCFHTSIPSSCPSALLCLPSVHHWCIRRNVKMGHQNSLFLQTLERSYERPTGAKHSEGRSSALSKQWVIRVNEQGAEPVDQLVAQFSVVFTVKYVCFTLLHSFLMPGRSHNLRSQEHPKFPIL